MKESWETEMEMQIWFCEKAWNFNLNWLNQLDFAQWQKSLLMVLVAVGSIEVKLHDFENKESIIG